jgi:hypothetical protein
MAEETDLDPFTEFSDCTAIYAFFHSTFGDDGLRELLSLVVGLDQESLLRDAAALAEMGLLNTAEIVAEHAASIAPETNPFPENTGDWRNWNRRHKQDFTGFLSER